MPDTDFGEAAARHLDMAIRDEAAARHLDMAIRDLQRMPDAKHVLLQTLRAVWRWAKAGRIPYLRTPGGHLRYREDDVRRVRAGGRGDRMTATATVDKPGVYNMPLESYLGDPVPGGSLSSTGARKLLPPSCPALFRYWLDHADEPKQVWDIGHGAHRLALGEGPELVRIDAEEWRTNAVKAEVAAARERGAVPLRPSDWDTVHAMAEALKAHPFAGRLFSPETGRAERTLVWQDERTGVWCRALIDWLRRSIPGRRFLLVDYKSARSAAPDKVGRMMADFGYHVQLGFYLAGCRALGLAGDDAEALMVVQETRPPYLVTVVQPDATAMRLGAIRVHQAIDIYAACTATGRWPGYADDVVLAELPPWETRELERVVW